MPGIVTNDVLAQSQSNELSASRYNMAYSYRRSSMWSKVNIPLGSEISGPISSTS